MNRFRLSMFMLSFALIGVVTLLVSSAQTPRPYAVVEPENGSHSGTGTARVVADATASGGKYLRYEATVAVAPTPTPAPSNCSFPTDIVPVSEMPTKNEIIGCAGLKDPSVLTPSGSLFTSRDGQVIENLDISGMLSIDHNNVTVRNVRVRGITNSVLIRTARSITGTVIEHCFVETLAAGLNEKSNGIGYLGNNTTVRYCEVTGSNGDGIKAESNSLYEYNYVHMFKAPGHSVHLDGMQGSGDTAWTARFNVVDMGIENGGNSSLFAQGWNGSSCISIANITFHNNYINGGNHGVNVAGGKEGRCPNAEDSYVTNARVLNNVFAVDSDGILGTGSTSGFRYFYYTSKYVKPSELTISGNVLSDGRAVTGSKTPHP